jgi:iron complex outermembrane receptor protein
MGNFIQPYHHINVGRARTCGAEVSTNWNLAARWKVMANWSGLRVRNTTPPGSIQPSRLEANGWAPAHQVQVRSQVDVSKKIHFDAWLYGVTRLSNAVPAYARVDARLGWRVSPRLDLAGGVRNLLDDHHLEFQSEDFTRPSQPRRAAFVQMTWRF